MPQAFHSDEGSGHSGTPPQLSKRYGKASRNVLLCPLTLCLASFTSSAKFQRPPVPPSRSRDPFWEWRRTQRSRLGLFTDFPHNYPEGLCCATLPGPPFLPGLMPDFTFTTALQATTTSRLTPDCLHPSAQSPRLLALDHLQGCSPSSQTFSIPWSSHTRAWL